MSATVILKYSINGARFRRAYIDERAAQEKAASLVANGIAVTVKRTGSRAKTSRPTRP